MHFWNKTIEWEENLRITLPQGSGAQASFTRNKFITYSTLALSVKWLLKTMLHCNKRQLQEPKFLE